MSDFKIYSDIPRLMPSPAMPKQASNGSFGNLLKEAIQEVNDLEKASQREVQSFVNNETDARSVMMALEKADLSFQVMMQVRDRIVQAYQEIMKAQV